MEWSIKVLKPSVSCKYYHSPTQPLTKSVHVSSNSSICTYRPHHGYPTRLHILLLVSTRRQPQALFFPGNKTRIKVLLAFSLGHLEHRLPRVAAVFSRTLPGKFETHEGLTSRGRIFVCARCTRKYMDTQKRFCNKISRLWTFRKAFTAYFVHWDLC